jgi:hypothetical protein
MKYIVEPESRAAGGGSAGRIEYMENTIKRSIPCATCGAEMLWTQNSWHAGGESRAAYRCLNGHVLDPSLTRQCPACGVHDTVVLDDAQPANGLRCLRCGHVSGPRS